MTNDSGMYLPSHYPTPDLSPERQAELRADAVDALKPPPELVVLSDTELLSVVPQVKRKTEKYTYAQRLNARIFILETIARQGFFAAWYHIDMPQRRLYNGQTCALKAQQFIENNGVSKDRNGVRYCFSWRYKSEVLKNMRKQQVREIYNAK